MTLSLLNLRITNTQYIKRARTQFLVLFFVLGAHSLWSQGLKQRFVSATPPLVKIGNDTSRLGFVGGTRSPSFGSVDLDLDGIPEMVMKDYNSRRVQVFKIVDNGGEIEYQYAPALEEALPKLEDFFFFRDYDQDGKPDLFTGSNRITLYMNESTDDSVIFTRFKRNLLFKSGSSEIPITFKTSEQPGVALVDDDNLLDVLVFNDDGSRVVMYRNISSIGEPPLFELATDKWGYFLESGLNADIQLGVKKKAGHPGSKILPIDYDQDGDIDLLLSDVSSAEVTYLRNGRKDFNAKVDTMVEVVKQFPPGQPINVPSFPSLSLVDFDLDGDMDLLTSKSSTSPAINGLVWAYENVGDKAYDFQLTTKSFLQEEMIDIGFGSIPTTFDVDADGDLDLFISGINHDGGGVFDPQVGYINYFENIGTPTDPMFELKDNDFMNLSQRSYDFLCATFGDIDNDNKVDLVIGLYNGSVIYFKNQSGPDQPANFVSEPVNIEPIDVGTNARPLVYDVNGDQVNDLIIGEGAGTLNYWKGTGGGSFEEVTQEWGRVTTKTFYWKQERNNQGIVVDSSKVFLVQGSSKPTIADIDDDGKPDLLVGSTWGRMYLYPELDLSSETFIQAGEWYYSPYLNEAIDKDIGSNTAPHLVDINSDGKIDLLVGNTHGGVEFFGVDSVVVGIEEFLVSKGDLGTSMFPNPANGTVQFANHSNSEINVTIWEISGAEVMQFRVGEKASRTQRLEGGTFLVRFTGKDAVRFERLIVISR